MDGKTAAARLGAIGLTLREQRTLSATLVEGRSHVDVARAHGIKAASSRQRAWRARLKIAAAGVAARVG